MVLRKEIVVNVNRSDVDGRVGGGAPIEAAIKRALSPNYQDVQVDSYAIVISGRQFSYTYDTPSLVQALMEAAEDGSLHSVSFTLKGDRRKSKL